MNKNRRVALITTINYGIIALVTVLIFILLSQPEARGGHFWTSLISVIIAETAWYIYALFLFKNQGDFKKLPPIYFVYGIILSVYFVLVISIMVVFWLILKISYASFLILQFMVPFALCILGLGIFVIYNLFIKKHEQELESSVKQMKQMQLQAHSLKNELALWSHPARQELVSLLEKLEESFRFSDPVSHESLAATEQSLQTKLTELAEKLRELVNKDQEQADQEMVTIRHMVMNISNALTERNQQLTTLK